MDLTLAIRGLHKRYGRARVLEGVTLEVPRGAICGFLGRNGAGKTTALRIVMGIVRADEGSVELFGRVRKRPSLDDRRRIGSVSQEPTFYPWMTGVELGRFVRGFYPTWDDHEYARLLHAFDVPPDRRASLLSGGTRAKLGLALALAHRPELLILDEPTAGLDPVARREFLDLVQERSRTSGQTVLFSSHLVDEVERVADHVGILEAGRVRFQGSPRALVACMRTLPEGAPLPEGGTVISRDARTGRVYVRAAASAWSALGPDVVDAQEVSLEDAFLALISRAGHNAPTHVGAFASARPNANAIAHTSASAPAPVGADASAPVVVAHASGASVIAQERADAHAIAPAASSPDAPHFASDPPPELPTQPAALDGAAPQPAPSAALDGAAPQPARPAALDGAAPQPAPAAPGDDDR